jgi:pyruvate kinase
MDEQSRSRRLESLRSRLGALRKAIDEEEMKHGASIAAVLPLHRASAVNLAHYLGLRRQDVHKLQLELAAMGLSSLGRSEGHVRDTLRRIHAWLSSGHGAAADSEAGDPLDWAAAERRLHANTQSLFGPRSPQRHVYIMVTAPDATGVTDRWTDELLRAGADMLRINAAHGSLREWTAIAATFKARSAAMGKPGRVFVDLPGPKMRADIRRLEDAVLRWQRRKDRKGRTVAPTRLLLVSQHVGPDQVPIPPEWLGGLRTGDTIELTDTGGRKRLLELVQRGEAGVHAYCDRSLYLTEGLPLVWKREGTVLGRGTIGTLPKTPQELAFEPGDAFLLNVSGESEDPNIPVLAFADAAVLGQVREGERVLLDDGKLTAVVESVGPEGHCCRVQRVLKSPLRLRSGKGISFPDSDLVFGDVSPQDEAALAFALEHADGVALSFVSSPQDVALVGNRVKRSGRSGFGMILKLETRAAVRNLPAILFEALQYDPVGLMIARGDLAVELSFERLAELQEELLWFGEACHLPVIWATEVLDSVAHHGLPTRAEVTDAAMSMRAECVVLNKGPFIADATRMLADIIEKMESHQYKKRSLYRKLSVADSEISSGSVPGASRPSAEGS